MQVKEKVFQKFKLITKWKYWKLNEFSLEKDYFEMLDTFDIDSIICSIKIAKLYKKLITIKYL